MTVTPDQTVRPAGVATLSPQQEAAAGVAAKVLGAAPLRTTDAESVILAYPDGRLAALEEATLGDREDLRLSRLRRESDMQWPAPARWWWEVAINDLQRLGRVREAFPVIARACEARGVSGPDQLPATVASAVPDLHWLVHTVPARMLGHPGVLDRPVTVTLARSRSAAPGMATVPPALRDWLASEPAARAVRRLGRRHTQERHLYLTLGCTGHAAAALASLVLAGGVPPVSPPSQPGVSHLWLAPVLGHSVFVWSSTEGWTRHEPYR